MIFASFFVAGTPAPQGSKRIVQPKGHARPMLIEMSKKLGPWRTAVAVAAARERTRLGMPIDVPLRLDITFWFRRPKYSKFPAPLLDLDKLVRAVNDGLQAGGLIANDRMITTIGNARKRWTIDDGASGARITLLDDNLGLA